MAEQDPDLDAFFDEVSAAEAEVIVEDEKKVVPESKKDEDEAPAAKKAKTNHHRPMGVVVAASSSVPSSLKPSTQVKETVSEPVGPPTATTLPTISVAGPQPPLPPIAPPLPPGPPPAGAPTRNRTNKPHKRAAAGSTWVDATLDEWPENDYRLFVGNLDKSVTDEQLYQHFRTKYPSVAMAKVVRDNKTGVSKGFGFVSLLQPMECARAIREQDQQWLSSRPMRVKRSDWKERELNVQRKKDKKRKKHLS